MRALLVALLVAACGGDGKKAEQPRPIVSNEPAPEPVAERQPVPEPTPTPRVRSAQGDATGIPQCDEFVRLYRLCVGQMDPSAHDALHDSIDQLVDAFRQTASDPTNAGAMAETCAAMPEQIGPSLGHLCPGVWPIPPPMP